MAAHDDSQVVLMFLADTLGMDRQSRVRTIRTRVAIGATALLAAALGAVDGWGKAEATKTVTTPVAVQQPFEQTQVDQTQVEQTQVEQTAPAPMTTRQS
jgi:negative regulator of sigma E activity